MIIEVQQILNSNTNGITKNSRGINTTTNSMKD